MFKIKQYNDILDYIKRTYLQTVIVIFLLSLGVTKTNFTLSLISLYLLVTYAIVKCIALQQSVNKTNDKNIKFSWLTKAWFV